MVADPLPDAELEAWRYSPISDLPVADLVPATEPGDAAGVDRLDGYVSDRAATVTVVDGFVVDVDVDGGWAAKGLEVVVDASGAPDLATASLLPVGGADTQPVDGDALDTEVTVFDQLHRAFSPAAIRIVVPSGLAVTAPVVVVSHHATAGSVSFPHLVMEAGAGSEVSVVERQSSIDGFGLSIPVVEMITGDAANLRYMAIQENGSELWHLGRQVATVGSQATLNAGTAAFGGRYGRVRSDCRLLGRGATANLTAAYYGDGDQVLDFRTFQHHEARDTRSDLLFKGSQDDSSGSIYTGLIHIHEGAAGSNAFQTNRNIKLSDDAWAWSVPNLEIENNDVHCSHASTVSPVDGDQQFFLQARGVPPYIADRLIVAGFYDEVIERMPVASARDEIRRLIAEKLDRRSAPSGDEG
jgi:Fe-S cluster assembly protein SufD